MRDWSPSEYSEIQTEIGHLLALGAIALCEPTTGQFLSFFLIKKPDGSNRFILNLKGLNRFVQTQHFKLEDLRTACGLLEPEMYMATIDLKDAYFLVPIHKNYRKFLRFNIDNQLYEFNCLVLLQVLSFSPK